MNTQQQAFAQGDLTLGDHRFRTSGVADLAGQTFAAEAIERAGGRVTGVRVFPTASASAGVLISVEFLEPAAAPSAGAAVGAAGAAGADSGGIGSGGVGIGCGSSYRGGRSAPSPPPALPSTPLASPRPPRLARDSGDPTPDSWDSDCPNSYPSSVVARPRLGAEAVGDVYGEGLAVQWMMRRSLARALGLPFGPDMRESSSPRPRWHPPSCPCGRPTSPHAPSIPVEERSHRMELG